MKKYRVYLTKSPEVAGLIAKAYKLGEGGVCAISQNVSEDIFGVIPRVYCKEGYRGTVITYNEDAPVKDYELIIA